MKCEIIAVGTELLMGQISNTNAQYISARLPEVDVYVYYHTVVGDNRERLLRCIDTALLRCDIIILTGGLGPTQDDITKETVSEYVNRKLIPDQDTLHDLERFFKSRNSVMCPNNRKQAYYPEGSILVKNKNGTAPGCIIEEKNKIIVLLPGPPWEMKSMFDDSIMPYLKSKAVYKLESRYLRLFGIGESSMEDRINDIIKEQTNPTIAPYAKMGEVTLRVSAKYEHGKEDPESIINPVISEIYKRLGEYIYSEKNEELYQVTANLLIKNNTTVSLAESCSGGLLASMITSVPGISKVFLQSYVTYSNESKIRDLGVDRKIIDDYGAVSGETALEMAKGAKIRSNADIGVSITGIAGPDGGSEEKPVGLVYIALASDKDTFYKKLTLWGDRDKIRHLACLHALDTIRRHLTERK